MERALLQTWRSRNFQLAVAGMDVVASERATSDAASALHPLFVSVMAHEGGARGYANRTEAMRMLFGDVLPDEISGSRTKAGFGQPYWTHYSQEFGRSWNGEGVDPGLVDVDVLERSGRDPSRHLPRR